MPTTTGPYISRITLPDLSSENYLNGATKTYSIIVTKIDNRSKDNTLSALSVSNLDLQFNQTANLMDKQNLKMRLKE